MITAHRLHRSRRVVLIAAVTGLMLSACGPDGPDADGAANDAPAGDEADPSTAPVTTVEFDGEVVDVIALDNSFRAESIEVSAGTAVRWENRGHNDHNVLPTDDAQQWGVETDAFVPGDEYTWVFDEPGTYAYYCSIHGTKDVGMVGTIVVSDGVG